MNRILLRIALLSAALAPHWLYAEEMQPVALQLKWYHQFQFAGYYAALEKGFYREAGLTVEIREGDPLRDPIDEVIGGKADFGIAASELVLARAAGKPVVAVAPIIQHSPLILLALRNAQTQTIHDLIGRTIEIVPHEHELFAFFQAIGIDREAFTLVPRSADLGPLLRGEVAAVSAYSTDEPFLLQQRGMEFLEISPRAAGIDFYGDTLFTSEALALTQPQRVNAFRDASLRGWHYALEHPEEIAELIQNKYNPGKSRDHLRYEAKMMRTLIMPEVVELGYMSPGRWRHIADSYANLGLMAPELALEPFLFQQKHPQDLGWLYWAAAAALLIALVAATIALYILRLNSRLSESEERYRVLYESAPMAIVVWDAACRITAWNAQAEQMFGWSREEVLGQDFRRLMIPPREQENIDTLVRTLLTTEATIHTLNWNITRSGRELLCEWMNAPLHDSDGRLSGIAALAIDVTEKKRLEETLQQLAHYDSLTGLPNRPLFFDRLQHDLSTARRHHTPLALMYLDLDGFKGANDTFGHDFGDALLQEVGARLRGVVRESDTLARMGGDEFTLILPGIARQEDAETVAQKVLGTFSAPFSLAGHEWQLGASIGISLFPHHSDEAEELVGMADRAMYQVKRSGKQGYRCYDTTLSGEGAPRDIPT